MLKDPKKREIYDQYGEDAIKEGMADGPGPGGGMQDIFDMMSGGRGGRRERKGDNVVHKLKVTLEECYNGSIRKLQLTRRMKCEKCAGTGTKSGRSSTCQQCHGQYESKRRQWHGHRHRAPLRAGQSHQTAVM